MTQDQWLKAHSFVEVKPNTWSRGEITLRKSGPCEWYARTADAYADGTTPRSALLALAASADSRAREYRTKAAELGSLAAELRVVCCE